MLFVVSHSGQETIARDYQTHFGILPDTIYGWDMSEEKRKPNPFPILDIMAKYGYCMKMVGRIPEALSGAMANQMYMATFPTREAMNEFYKDVLDCY